MTIPEVASQFDVEEKTVETWCEKQWIRGVKCIDGKYDIPASVKRPYNKRRAQGDAIYTSIIKGVLGGYDVTASLYDLSEAEFEKYIQQLKDAGVVDTYIDKNTKVEYLCRTLKSNDFSKLRKNKVKSALKELKPQIIINAGINQQ